MSFGRLLTGGYGPLLALCALVGVLWAGSYRSVAHVKLPVSAGATRWELASYRGTISISAIENHPTAAQSDMIARPDNLWTAALWDARCATAAVAGFSVEDSQIWVADVDGALVPRRLTAVNVPYWALLMLVALGPLQGLYVVVRACRRATHNQCGACGYELGDGVVCQACAARRMVLGPTHRMQLVRPAA